MEVRRNDARRQGNFKYICFHSPELKSVCGLYVVELVVVVIVILTACTDTAAAGGGGAVADIFIRILVNAIQATATITITIITIAVVIVLHFSQHISNDFIDIGSRDKFRC